MDQIKVAINIAKTGLRSCYTDRGIHTGSRRVYWSWDSFFASFGALEIGDHEIVKKNLELYFKYQNSSGNIPKRIAHPLYAFKYIKLPVSEKPIKQKPNYASPYYLGPSISQCPVFIISFYQYLKKSRDKEFLIENYSKLKKMLVFLDKYRYKSGLLRETVGGGWAESVLKRGAITYTNICYLKSMLCMLEMAKKLDKKGDIRFFQSEAIKVKTAIDQKLWEKSKGGFYSDWYGFSRHHHFNADGNLLALWWNIASNEQIKKIDLKINELLSESDPPVQQTSDRYFFWRIFLANQISGLKNYHTRFSWLWLGCLAALAKKQIGQEEQGRKILRRIAKKIVEFGSVYEIYFNGRPVDLFFYKSEKPWAWAAGLFIFACQELGFPVR